MTRLQFGVPGWKLSEGAPFSNVCKVDSWATAPTASLCYPASIVCTACSCMHRQWDPQFLQLFNIFLTSQAQYNI